MTSTGDGGTRRQVSGSGGTASGGPAGAEPTVYRITEARKGITEDVGARQRRYLISMGIRTVCFVLAIVFTGWLRWAMIVGALLLPYVSVVFANGGREPSPGPPTTLMDPPRAIGSTPATPPQPPHQPPPPDNHGGTSAA